jgi:hypothetical protein
MKPSCPACGGAAVSVFHREMAVPSHSCLLLDDAESAREFATGQIALGVCDRCGFITNTAFDPSLSAYSARYEETQGYSQRFQAFATDLAKRWVEGYDLHGKTVCEIGCGKGEFLVHMVESGAGRGVGIDPGVDPARIVSPVADRIDWIRDLFSEKYLDIEADAIVCRHTLEHIGPVAEFLRLIRRSIGDRVDTPVLFELPDVARVLHETAFWDVYYEHCSYFDIGSLVRLFTRCGFDVLDARLEYDGQYIVLEARPAAGATGVVAGTISGAEAIVTGTDVAQIRDAAFDFERSYAATISSWRARLRAEKEQARRVALWGGGSKAVAFLSAVGAGALVDDVVDINPFKTGKYLAGSAKRVVAPEFLSDHPPDVVVAMNAIYRDEIAQMLTDLRIEADLWAV